MPRNQRTRDRELRVRPILEAAEALFRSGSYESTTMIDVARQAQVAPNTIYWYFPSKDDLLLALLERANSDLIVQIEQLARRENGLELLLDYVIAASRRNLPLDRLVRQRAMVSDGLREWRMRVHRHFHAAVVTALLAVNPSVHKPELLAEAAISVVEGAFDYETPERSAEQVIRHVIPLLAHAMEPAI